MFANPTNPWLGLIGTISSFVILITLPLCFLAFQTAVNLVQESKKKLLRGKGLGKAMTLKAMLSAQKKDFHKCVLTATNDARYLYKKIGFEDLKTMKVYHEP